MNLVPGNHRAWSSQFARYAEWNGREGQGLFLGQVSNLAFELYTQTAAIAPTKSEIAADVKAQGWKIPAFFKDGRVGRGFAYMWANRTAGERTKRAAKRGRPAKGGSRTEIAESILEKGATLAQMQAFVIAARTKARLFLASGWLGAMADMGAYTPNDQRRGAMQDRGGVNHERGGATIRREPSQVSVELWNRTPGIEQMNAKHQLVAKAVAVRWADMQVYITRKMNEAQRRYFAATN